MPDWTAFCHTCQRYFRERARSRQLVDDAADAHRQSNPDHEVTVQRGR